MISGETEKEKMLTYNKKDTLLYRGSQGNRYNTPRNQLLHKKEILLTVLIYAYFLLNLSSHNNSLCNSLTLILHKMVKIGGNVTILWSISSIRHLKNNGSKIMASFLFNYIL